MIPEAPARLSFGTMTLSTDVSTTTSTAAKSLSASVDTVGLFSAGRKLTITDIGYEWIQFS